MAPTCLTYFAIRFLKRPFFNDLRTLSCYLRFPSWEAMLAFMIEALDQPFTAHAQVQQSPS